MNLDRLTDKDTDLMYLTVDFFQLHCEELCLWPQPASQRTVFLILCPNRGHRDVTHSHNVVVHRDKCLYWEVEQLG